MLICLLFGVAETSVGAGTHYNKKESFIHRKAGAELSSELIRVTGNGPSVTPIRTKAIVVH